MPRQYTCPTCGRITPSHHCPAHQPNPNAHRSPNRNSNQQTAFRQAVLKRDGHRCQHCGARAQLVAHHIQPLRNYPPNHPGAYDPANGITLCHACHQKEDPYVGPTKRTHRNKVGDNG